MNGYDGIDTQTGIVKSRREDYKSYVRYIRKLIQEKRLSRSELKTRILNIEI